MGRFLGVVVLSLVALVGAAWLAFRVPDLPYETLEVAYTSPTSQFITLETGGRVHYRDEGLEDGPVLVLVHGFSASLHTWEDWVGALGEDYRILSLDLPGHGLSRNFDLEAVGTSGFVEVIDAITRLNGIDRFALAGSSMGGHAAWAYALEHPEKVEGLILVAAAGWPPTEAELEGTPLVFKALGNGLVRRVVKDLDVRPMVKSGLEASFVDQSFVTDAMVDRYAALNRGPGHRRAIVHLLSGDGDRTMASEAALATISAPTLVLHGDQDRLVPVSSGRRFADVIPGAEIVIYENVGHIPQEEVAAESAEDVRDFLDERVWPTAAPVPAVSSRGSSNAVSDGLNQP
ncbi:MAG: alpha/beta fold hydrolase [Pseudomonadota bacterium]